MAFKRRTWPALPALLALAFALGACGDSADSPNDGPDVDVLQSDLARNTSPDVPVDDMNRLIDGNHTFTLDLFGALSGDPGSNLMVSPYSIRLAFAMVYAGAKGETADEMALALDYVLEESALHNAFNALDLALADRNDPGDGGENDPVELYVANAFWGQTGFPFLDDYLDVLAVNYGAGVYPLDFDNDAEGSRIIINEWVEARTRDRIQDLLPEGSIDASTAAVLTNAVYLKAPWASKFEEEATRDGAFNRLDGSPVTVPFMNQLGDFGYSEGADYQALEMTYRNDELSMVFLLPADGQHATFEAGLDPGTLQGILDDLESRQVQVSLPKFEFEFETRLKDTLMGMGMVIPFTGAADLSGMVEGGGLLIDEAYHKTFILVEEGGTEAAAATAIVVRETSAPIADVTFAADRPFLFLIRDRVTGAILFFGRLSDPG